MSDVIDAVRSRSDQLAEQYTNRLDAVVNEIVPPMLDNEEYAARCSALMIALNRELARCAAAFGEAHGVEPGQMIELVETQFASNYQRALFSVRGAGNA